MKDSDLHNARRVLHLIRLLTAEELSGVEIVNDNPDFNGLPDCLIQYRHWNDVEQINDFRADTLLDCLLQAMASRGLIESADWAGDPSTIVPNLKSAVEDAKSDVGLRFDPAPVTIAAVKALEMWARCKSASDGSFNGGAMVPFQVGSLEFELTIKPKRTGFSFVETADSIENDRAGEPEFGEPLSIEDELATVLGMGSPVQDLRGEYAAAYHRAHLEAIQEVGRCEGCGITAEELKKQGGELNTHHAISVERIFNEGLDPALVGDRKNLVVVCRNGGDECHFLIGHDDDGPGGRGPSWSRSNKHVRRDLAAHFERVKHSRRLAKLPAGN